MGAKNGLTVLDMTRWAMACEFRILIAHPDEHYARQVAEAAFDEIYQLESAFNCFDPKSEISYLNAHAHKGYVAVSPDLFEILSFARQIYQETDGALDVTIGPLVALWKSAEQSKIRPDGKAIRDATDRVGMQHLILDPETNSVRFAKEGLQINLGSIGKGYAVGKAVEILRSFGVSSGLISAGNSTTYALGLTPDGTPWQIGIRHPESPNERVAVVELVDRSLSTSGGPRQRDEQVEEFFEHIIDPSTGEPVQTDLISASVITTDPTLADALSTAFYLRGKTFASHYCLANEGIEAILVEKYNSNRYTLSTIRGGII